MARSKTKKQIKRRRSFRYPLFILLLICAGLFLLAVTFNVSADDILVKAKVSAPFVTSPPVINSAINGQTYHTVPIEISGTCPTNAAYVEISRNGFMSGSAICQNGLFDPEVDLFVGKNVIEAEAFNSTDDEGPASAPVTIYYQPPTSSPALQTSPTAAPPSMPLKLTTDFVYKGYYTNQQVQWPLEISGGSAPYAVNVEWGDGQNSVISRAAAGQFQISHTYKVPGGFHNSFTIKVQISDVNGNYTYLQFFVIVSPKTPANTGSIFTKAPPTITGYRLWLWAAWPLYATILLMALAYKLGEREELIILKRRGLLRR